MAKTQNKIICPDCRGTVEIKSENSSSKDGLQYGICSTCGAHFSMGEINIKVEGNIYDEVKDVASHLIDKVTKMQKEDKDYLRKKELKKELKNDKVKKLLVVGGFWIGIFLGLGYFLLQIATRDIGWYKFVAIIMTLPVFFIIVGAFTLKTTSSLKEENFIKLILLTLKLNFKGLNSLTATKQKGGRQDNDEN